MNDWDKLYGAALEVQNERSVSSFIEQEAWPQPS